MHTFPSRKPAWLSAFFLMLLLVCIPLKNDAQILHNFTEGIRESYQSKPKFMIGFDSRRSFVSARDVKLWGLRAGFEMAPKVRMGFGFYGLSTPFYRNFIVPVESGGQDTVASQLQFNYFSLFWEYVLHQKRRWEVSIPLHVGVGSSEFIGIDNTRNPIGVTELSVNGQYKIFSFLGLGAAVGYRRLVPANREVRENFNSMIYGFRIKIFAGALYNAIFKNESISDFD